MYDEEGVLDILDREGPLTGGELFALRAGDRFLLWRTCATSRRLRLERVGRRYLRLDERVPGYARLSPSILREFLTYTVVGAEGAPKGEKVAALASSLREIGDRKMAIAAKAMKSAMDAVAPAWSGSRDPCFVLAGDIAYGMAHAEARPERSTGKLVSGSDLDIVAVVDDSTPERLVELLDESIYREKRALLLDPSLRQEIDYVVKRVSKFEEQLRFDSFKRMVACKIMKEGLFLEGDRALFDELKLMLEESGVGSRLERMEEKAASERHEAESILERADSMSPECERLFYSVQESEEFE